MNIILLSGGSGRRLWPLSNDVRSKQFIKIFRNDRGEYESMVQRVYGQIKTADSEAKVLIATAKSQTSAINNQLGNAVDICVEPCRRDTCAAILLASLYLRDVKGLSPEESIVVCPVDPYVQQEYFECLKEVWELSKEKDANIVLMGIKPTYPSEKYGYIIPEDTGIVSGVSSFKEKPDLPTAEKFLAQGGLWNGGIFAYKLKYMAEKAKELTGWDTYEDLLAHYDELEKISIDFAIVEKESSLLVRRFDGEWKDIGSWNTLVEEMDDPCTGDVTLGYECENVNVLNELDIPIICMGLKDMVVAASPEGILVSDKHQSSYIKPFVDKVADKVMFAEKSWGSFKIIDVEENSLTILVTLNPGHKMNCHYHEHRDEIWNIVSGEGYAIIDGKRIEVKAGDVIRMNRGVRHNIYANSTLKIIEVQMGQDISVKDKIKCEE